MTLKLQNSCRIQEKHTKVNSGYDQERFLCLSGHLVEEVHQRKNKDNRPKKAKDSKDIVLVIVVE